MGFISKSKKEIEALWSKVRSVDREVKSHENMLLNKAEVQSVRELKKLLETLPTHAEVKAQSEYVNEKIEKYDEDNDKFLIGFEQQEEMIRRFDEVLAQKTSTITLIEEMQAFDEKMDLKIKDVYKVTTEIENSIKSSNERVEQYVDLLRAEMEAASAKLTKKMAQKGGGGGPSKATGTSLLESE